MEKVRRFFKKVYNLPLIFLFAGDFLFMVLLAVQGSPLKTEAAPSGMFSFAFAFGEDKTQAILESWQSILHVARWQIYLDFIFLLIYPLLISRVCKLVNLPKVPRIVLFAMLFDFLENIFLLIILSQQEWSLVAWLAGGSAILKWLLTAIGLGGLLFAGLRKPRLFFRQLNNFRFLLLFGLFVFLTPLSAILLTKTIFNRMLGGLFVDLDWRQEFIGTLIAALLILVILKAQALIVDGVLAKYSMGSRFRKETIFKWQYIGLLPQKIRYWMDESANEETSGEIQKELDKVIPRWLDTVFGFPLGRWQALVAFILILPWAVVTITNAGNQVVVTNLIACFLGCIAAIIFFVLTIITRHLLSQTLEHPTLKRFFTWKVFTKKIHLFALTSFLLTIVWYFAVRIPFIKGLVPPIGFFLILLIALAWIIGAIEFHGPVRGIPPFLGSVLVIGIIALLINRFQSHSYYFRVTQDDVVQKVPLFSKDNPVFSGVNNGNLVVVAVSGGGILSASWSTYWLYQLLNARPELACEIRLFSTVSGGTVGMAHYLAALKQRENELDCDTEDGRQVYIDQAKSAFDRAHESSLSTVTYGMAYSDLWRAITAGSVKPFGRYGDRGNQLESRWRENATIDVNSMKEYTVSSFASLIETRQMPAFIFNSTILETGERVMITPLDFNGDRKRARTISEILTGETNQIDLDLFTAARLSATFPYVSPATSTNLNCDSRPKSCNYHFLDGGYHENFGIQSMLDFLRVILEEDKSILRVLIIEMRLTNFQSEANIPPAAKGFAAGVLGPPIGIFNSGFAGGQIARNDIDLDNFIHDWKEKGLPIEVLTIQPTEDVNGPLSWHLPSSQQDKLFPTKSDPNNTDQQNSELITYNYVNHIPQKSENQITCNQDDDKPELEDCALKDVFETWVKETIMVGEKKSYKYEDCLHIMNSYLEGKLENKDFPEACRTR